MYCKNCGTPISDEKGFCTKCGAEEASQSIAEKNGVLRRCEKCGGLGVPVLESKITKKDWIIAIITLPLGYGLIHLITTWFSKTINPKRQRMICPLCGKPYEKRKLSLKEELIGDWEGLKVVAKDKNVQSAVVEGARNVKKSAHDFSDSLSATPRGW